MSVCVVVVSAELELEPSSSPKWSTTRAMEHEKTITIIFGWAERINQYFIGHKLERNFIIIIQAYK